MCWFLVQARLVLWRLAVAKHVGARNVVITDVNEYRLELARKMGITRAVNVAKENLNDVMAELGMTEGFDVVWKCPVRRQRFVPCLTP